jgi:hypothetical protein
METYLGKKANIVHNQNFENAVVKVLEGGSNLTISEDLELEPFKTPSSIELDPEEDNNLSLAEQIKNNMSKRQKQNLNPNAKHVIDFQHIPSGSVKVERFFSSAKHVLTDQRTRLLPSNLENILCLKENHKWWDMKSVIEAMKQ